MRDAGAPTTFVLYLACATQSGDGYAGLVRQRQASCGPGKGLRMSVIGQEKGSAGGRTAGPTQALALARRLGLAVCDQGFFAGASFIFTLLLARWLTKDEFGAFSVAYAVLLLMLNLYDGLVSEPLAIFGAGRFADRFAAYVGRVLVGHLIIGTAMAGLLGLLAGLLHALGVTALAGAFTGMAVAAPLLCARSLTRQPLYVLSRIQGSVAAGAVHLSIGGFGLALLKATGQLSPATAFLAIGAGGAIASLGIVAFCLQPVWHSTDRMLGIRTLVSTHLTYGGWATGERLLLWAQINVLYLGLPVFAGLHATAAFRAAATLAMPAIMTVMALGTALLPALVRAAAQPVEPRWVRLLAPMAALAVLSYAVLLTGFGHAIAHMLFAGQYDAELDPLLLALTGSGAVLNAVQIMLELQARARLRIRAILHARLMASAVMATAGLGLLMLYDLRGAALASALNSLTTLAALRFSTCRRATASGELQ
jgi:O-antigen/teichoic acid export membrane protein